MCFKTKSESTVLLIDYSIASPPTPDSWAFVKPAGVIPGTNHTIKLVQWKINHACFLYSNWGMVRHSLERVFLHATPWHNSIHHLFTGFRFRFYDASQHFHALRIIKELKRAKMGPCK